MPEDQKKQSEETTQTSNLHLHDKNVRTGTEEIKMTMINILKALRDRVNSMQDLVGNRNRKR